MRDKTNRFISQTIGISCACCGKTTKLNNRYPSDVFVLEKDGEMYFNCPECNESYDIPFKNKL
ncbi:hypothetical protein COE51_01370 [Bacillus pseudomycoides]|nr:hypothetical protein COE51_01370 [Bacillus pseudomycoides]